jgi:hypothetical protein
MLVHEGVFLVKCTCGGGSLAAFVVTFARDVYFGPLVCTIYGCFKSLVHVMKNHGTIGSCEGG